MPMRKCLKNSVVWVGGAFVAAAIYVAGYIALVTPSYSGTIDGVEYNLGKGTATLYALHAFAPEYGSAGRWNCLEPLFRPIHAIDRRARPEKWQHLQK